MTNAPPPLLKAEKLSIALPKGGDRVLAVNELSFELHAGKTLCIVGESGSGKSLTALSLLRLLPGEVRREAGAIYLNGRDISALSPAAMRQIRGRDAAMIFQEPMTALNPVWTIGSQMLEMWRKHTDLDSAACREAMLNALREVELPDPPRIAASYPHQLSGGQRQRVMIAMALALGPPLLIADEPTTALDVTTQARILRLIKRLQAERGMGVLFITHDFGVVSDIADEVLVMQKGVCVEQGSAEEVLKRPRHPYTQALIKAVPSLTPPPPRSHSGDVILSVSALNKTYRTRSGFAPARVVVAVKSASFRLHAGETLGIVGESGSGKSTLARLILGLEKTRSGEILLGGTDLVRADARAWKAAREKLQIVFQDPFGSLNRRRRVGDIIAQGPVNFGVPRAKALQQAAELLRMVGLSAAAADRYPHQFSGGQRQRIAIARALALNPSILVADEAVSALDVSVQAQILDLLRDLRSSLNLSMLFITHDLRVAAQTCDRLIVMWRGAIVEEGQISDIYRAPKHEYTKTLLDAAPGRGAI